jgi:ureidoacrylate peracid hydrolase
MSTPLITVDRGQVTIRPRPIEGAPPGMGHPIVLEPGRTAVVIVDAQRFFMETPPFSSMRAILPPLVEFLAAARDAGIAVMHVRTEFDPSMSDAGRPGTRTRFMMDSVGRALVRGNPLADIAPELHGPSDIIVTKTRFSGFWDSSLDQTLRARGIESIVFAGGTTTVCVESTVRDAVFLEYNPVVLSDCTQDMSPELHESAMNRMEMFFGWVCSSTELLAALRGVNRTART